MLDRPVAVGADLVRLRVERDRDQVVVHRVGAVLVAGRLLHRRTAAEVEVPAGHARRPAVHRGPLQQQHPRAGPGGLECGAAAGDAEADDHDVPRLGLGGEVVGGKDFGIGGAGQLGHAAKTRTCFSSWGVATDRIAPPAGHAQIVR